MSPASPVDLPVPRLLVWRHGRTEWNANGRFQGQLDPPLDDEGRRQAVRAAAVLAATLPARDTIVVASDLGRAVQTAAVLTDRMQLPLRLDPRLRELGLGCWEGLTRDEVADRFPEQYADWLAGRPVRGRGGEQTGEVTARALAAVADLPVAAAAVVVTHGGTSARLIEALLGLGPDRRRMLGHLRNCAWSELHHEAGQWRLTRHNVPVPQGLEGTRTGGGAAPGAPVTAEDVEPLAADTAPEGADQSGDADAAE